MVIHGIKIVNDLSNVEYAPQVFHLTL